MTNEEDWYCKEYLCPDCDSYTEISTKSSELRDKNCLECKGELVLISSRTYEKEWEKLNNE